MLKVHLEGLINENIPRHESDDGLGWAEWRALKLKDEETDSQIAEWFYAVACNKHFMENQVQASEGKQNGYFLQEKFSEEELYEAARSSFSELSFEDWDDLYAKMQQKFIYED